MYRLQYILKTLLVFFILISSLSFAAYNVKSYTTIQNNPIGGITVSKTPSGNYGVTAFDFISHDMAALLCSSERKIKIINTMTNTIIKEYNTNFFPEDFIYSSNCFFILSDHSIYKIDESGKEIDKFLINDEFNFIDRLKTIDSSLYVLTSDGNSYKVIDNGKILLPDQQLNNFVPGWLIDKTTSINTTRNNDNEFTVNIFNNGIKSREERIFLNKKLGSALVIGNTGDITYIDVQFILQDIPLKIERNIFAYSLSTGSIIDTIEIPENYRYYTKHDFNTFNNNLYKLFSLEDKTDILELTYSPDCPKTIFPQKYYKEYHYNYFLPDIGEETRLQKSYLKPSDSQPVTRDQILANADKFEKIKWYCSENNTSNYTVIRLPDGATIRTPLWVVQGNKVKMPYKWGGFTRVEDFNARISAGSYAGDDYISREQDVVSSGDQYCVGVDCSGFVSRVWGRTQREWTGSLANISTQLQSWSQLKPGDIANKAGSHTMLFVSTNSSGTFNIIQASGYDWRVSYLTINLNDLSGYVPLKYNYVEEVTSVNEDITLTKDFKLFQNYPNPFNPETVISYRLSSTCYIQLKVFDILGREIITLVNKEQNAGNYSIKFNGNYLESGTYFVKLQAGNYNFIKKMMLLK